MTSSDAIAKKNDTSKSAYEADISPHISHQGFPTLSSTSHNVIGKVTMT